MLSAESEEEVLRGSEAGMLFEVCSFGMGWASNKGRLGPKQAGCGGQIYNPLSEKMVTKTRYKTDGNRAWGQNEYKYLRLGYQAFAGSADDAMPSMGHMVNDS